MYNQNEKTLQFVENLKELLEVVRFDTKEFFSLLHRAPFVSSLT